jgi:hypothetical protein
MLLLPYILLQAIAAHPVCHLDNFNRRQLRVWQLRMLADWAMRLQQRLNRALA